MSKYGVFSWSVFSRIRTECEEILRISLYSVRIRENTDQKKLRIWKLLVSLRIQTECGKIRTRKNSVFAHFSRSDGFYKLNAFQRFNHFKNLNFPCIAESNFSMLFIEMLSVSFYKVPVTLQLIFFIIIERLC